MAKSGCISRIKTIAHDAGFENNEFFFTNEFTPSFEVSEYAFGNTASRSEAIVKLVKKHCPTITAIYSEGGTYHEDGEDPIKYVANFSEIGFIEPEKREYFFNLCNTVFNLVEEMNEVLAEHKSSSKSDE